MQWVWDKSKCNTKSSVWCFKLEIWCFTTWVILSNMFFYCYKLSILLLLVIDKTYRRSLEQLCVCSCSRREINWNYFSFPIWTFAIKVKRKDAMNVSLCNSGNSLIMYNMEIMIKISFVITMMLTAIIIIDFDCFQM